MLPSEELYKTLQDTAKTDSSHARKQVGQLTTFTLVNALHVSGTERGQHADNDASWLCVVLLLPAVT